MKYNEAIDMILDGGEAYRAGEPGYRYKFESIDGTIFLLMSDNGGGFDEHSLNIRLTEYDFDKDDWIVEKDGVVYEEYPGRVISGEMIVCGWKHNIPDDFVKVTLYAPPVELRKIPMTESGYKKLDALLESGNLLIDERGTPLERVLGVKILISRTHDQDEPAELEEGGEPWEEIKMPIIADEVNEDWLEKKMLCFAKRYNIAIMTVEDGEEVIDNLQDSK